MSTLENNKIIAEFMDMKYGKERTFNKKHGWTYSERSLQNFQSSWNWIMPVVEKCLIGEGEAEGEQVDLIELIYEALTDININATYKAVVNFIKWYNEQQEAPNEEHLSSLMYGVDNKQ